MADGRGGGGGGRGGGPPGTLLFIGILFTQDTVNCFSNEIKDGSDTRGVRGLRLWPVSAFHGL